MRRVKPGKNIVITLLIFGFVFMIGSITVKSEERKIEKENLAVRTACEKQMILDVRKSLEDKGYDNCGVMLTKVIDDDFITYTVSIHHKQIDRLDGNDRNLIVEALRANEFDMENVAFNYEIILN